MENMKNDFNEAKSALEKDGLLKSFLSFDKMITPVIIKVLFYIGVIISILIGISLILNGVNAYFGGGALVFLGLLTIILGPIMVKVYCEILIVIFKIHESLVEIKNK